MHRDLPAIAVIFPAGLKVQFAGGDGFLQVRNRWIRLPTLSPCEPLGQPFNFFNFDERHSQPEEDIVYLLKKIHLKA